jgi:glycerol-3-phosphate O-acyltransferase
VREATLLLEKDGCLQEIPASGEMYLVAEADRRLQLSFYKNNLLHPLVPVSLVCAALLSFKQRGPTIPELRERTLWLSRLFKYEFVYRVGVGFGQIFDETLELCRQLGLLDPTSPEVVRPSSISGRERIELLRDLTRDFIESYFLAADALSELFEGELEVKELTKRALGRGHAAYLAGRISGPESLAKPNFENAWMALREAGLITGEKKVSLQGEKQKAVAYRDEIAKFL